MYFVSSRTADVQDIMLLARHIEDEVRDKGPENAKALLDSLMSQEQADAFHAEFSAHNAVAVTIVRGVDDDD